MFKIRARFQDKNQPAINTEAETPEQAYYEAMRLSKQFAGLLFIYVTEPSGNRHIYDGRGEYLFSEVKEIQS